MTEQETHFERAEKIAYEDLAIALEKANTTIQEKDKEIETLKADFRVIQMVLNTIDLSPATKEETFNWKK